MSQLKKVKGKDGLYRDVVTHQYYGLISRSGKIFKEALGTRRSDIATSLLKDFRAKYDAGLDKDAADLTWAQLRERFIGTVEDDGAVKRAGQFVRLKTSSVLEAHSVLDGIEAAWPRLPDIVVRKIKPSDCAKWFEVVAAVDAKGKPRLGALRLNALVNMLKRILEHAVELRAAVGNPAAKLQMVKVGKKKPVFPSKSDFAAVIRDLRLRRLDDAADLAEFIGLSGVRLDEASHVTWGDCKNGRLVVRGLSEGSIDDDPKNHSQRSLPLFVPLANLLGRIRARRGDVDDDEPVMVQYECRGALRAACDRCNVKRFSHQALRRMFADNCLEAGATFQAVSGWLGHGDGGVLLARVYSGLRDEHSEMMAAKITWSAAA